MRCTPSDRLVREVFVSISRTAAVDRRIQEWHGQHPPQALVAEWKSLVKEADFAEPMREKMTTPSEWVDKYVMLAG
jgi:hypothetical protein